MTYKIFDIETTGLSPIEKVCVNKVEIDRVFHRIIAISVLNHDTKEVKVFTGEDEKQILLNFFNELDFDDVLVGFNINFDINFIKVRAFALGIDALHFNDLAFIDIRDRLNNQEYAVGRLRDYAKMLNIEAITEDGEKMIEYYKNKDWYKIEAHSREDVEITDKLFVRCRECNLV